MHHEHNAETNRPTAGVAAWRGREGEEAGEWDCSGEWSKSFWPAAGQAGIELDIRRRAVMPVEMNAISSHRKWCQNVSRGPTDPPPPSLYPSLSLASCCYPGELWVLQSCAISNRTRHACRHSASRPVSPPLVSSRPASRPTGMPCNTSHGQELQQHAGLHRRRRRPLSLCLKNSQFIPEWPQLN